jgi:hypothetical protein
MEVLLAEFLLDLGEVGCEAEMCLTNRELELPACNWRNSELRGLCRKTGRIVLPGLTGHPQG